MGSLYSKNQNVKYFLCVIDVFTKYAWVKTLKDEKGETALNAFIEIVSESNRKPNKLWVDQRREFCNKLMQEWFENDDLLMYSTNIEGKSVIAGRFIRTSETKIYKKMTVNDSKSYLSYFNKIVDQYNNSYHHSINKNPINGAYSDLTENIETNPKASKFEVNDSVKVVLVLSNYAIKKEIDLGTSFDTSDFAAKNILLIRKLKLTD